MSNQLHYINNHNLKHMSITRSFFFEAGSGLEKRKKVVPRVWASSVLTLGTTCCNILQICPCFLVVKRAHYQAYIIAGKPTTNFEAPGVLHMCGHVRSACAQGPRACACIRACVCAVQLLRCGVHS